MEDGRPSQGLLLPETIECKPTDADFLNRSIELFQKLGVGIREFGQNTFILEALPLLENRRSHASSSSM